MGTRRRRGQRWSDFYRDDLPEKQRASSALLSLPRTSPREYGELSPRAFDACIPRRGPCIFTDAHTHAHTHITHITLANMSSRVVCGFEMREKFDEATKAIEELLYVWRCDIFTIMVWKFCKEIVLYTMIFYFKVTLFIVYIIPRNNVI